MWEHFAPGIQYPFSIFLISFIHLFIFNSGGVDDTHFEVMPMWHNRYSCQLWMKYVLWILKFTLSTGGNDMGDRNAILWCLDFTTSSLKAIWSLSSKAAGKGLWRSVCLLHVNLQVYTSWSVLFDTVTLSHLHNFIDNCSPLPNSIFT